MADLTVVHPFEPVFDKHSRVLILGSFPSVKSREDNFYYAHKQNRFWKVLSKVFDCAISDSTQGKKEFLLSHEIALWDVVASCEICGSSDSTIKNVTVNDISQILNSADIKKICVNGCAAEKYYKKYMRQFTERGCILLPSTSPANAAWTLEKLIDAWKIIKL